MHDRTKGPPKQGEAFYMIPELTLMARGHGAISQVCALILDAVSDLDCLTGKAIIDHEALKIARYLLEPLLETGTARKASALEHDHPLRDQVQTVAKCIRSGDISPLMLSVWRRPLDRSAVMDFIVRRHGVYEISHPNVARLHGKSRKVFLQRIYLIALAVLTPADVQRGLPNPCHSFRKERDMNRGPGEVVPIYLAA